MYDWFIEIRCTLKARLLKSMFKEQCKIFYEQCLSHEEEEIPEEKRIGFSNKWIRSWMKEYNVSLTKPIKKFQINRPTERNAFLSTSTLSRHLREFWNNFDIDNFRIDPRIINGDRMPLHRNKSASQKTLNFTGYVTEIISYQEKGRPYTHKF